jgi:hypothetical protein
MPRRILAIAILALAGVAATGQSAVALDEPRVPQQVAAYFATGLVPRLADLFGAKAGAEVVFDATDRVGRVHRVLAWTSAYLAGARSGDPTELTNDWIADVTTSGGTVAGLATVWINPASDLPELADFAPGAALAAAIASAPTGTLIIRDDSHSAWFATDGTTLTPLVSGTSGVTAPTTAAAYQRRFSLVSPTAPAGAESTRGLQIAVLVLGIVVVLLAVYVLLPDRRRRARGRNEASDVVPPAAGADSAPLTADSTPGPPQRPASP